MSVEAAEDKIAEIVREEVKAYLPEILPGIIETVINAVEGHFSSDRKVQDKQSKARRKVKPENILQMIKEAPAEGIKRTQIVTQIRCSSRQIHRYMIRFDALGLYILELEPAKGRPNIGGKGRSYYPKKLTSKTDLILKNAHKLSKSWLSELESLGWKQFCRQYKIYPQL